jgi:hypothetical protein
MQAPVGPAPSAREARWSLLRWLAPALLWAACAGATAQVVTPCSPALIDLGRLSFAETTARTTCVQAAPVGQPGYTSGYSATFRFTLAEPTSFFAYASGLFRYPNGAGDSASGIGIDLAMLTYGDVLLASGTGRGIGGAERPVLLNPFFSGNPDFSTGPQPAGTYEISLLGRAFGPTYSGMGSMGVTVYASGLPPAPVTPVPEPLTVAMQAVGAALRAMLAIRRRRATSDLSH